MTRAATYAPSPGSTRTRSTSRRPSPSRARSATRVHGSSRWVPRSGSWIRPPTTSAHRRAPGSPGSTLAPTSRVGAWRSTTSAAAARTRRRPCTATRPRTACPGSPTRTRRSSTWAACSACSRPVTACGRPTSRATPCSSKGREVRPPPSPSRTVRSWAAMRPGCTSSARAPRRSCCASRPTARRRSRSRRRRSLGSGVDQVNLDYLTGNPVRFATTDGFATIWLVNGQLYLQWAPLP